MAKTIKLAPIPKSRAKTADGLLGDVQRIILAEPKRYDQGTYIERRDEPSALRSRDLIDFPSCGTVGCIAGWVVTLKRTRRFGYSETPYLAAKILGLTRDQSQRLFTGLAVESRPGSQRHARAGVKHIQRFRETYAVQLKAKKV